MDADGTDTTPVNTGTGDATEPAWSPDGTRIAFVSTRTGARGRTSGWST